MVKKKSLWYKINGQFNENVLDKVLNLNYQTLYWNSKNEDIYKIVDKLPQRIRHAVEIDSPSEINVIKKNKILWEKLDAIFCKNLNHLEEVKNKYKTSVGMFLSVNDKASLEFAVDEASLTADIVAIDFKDSTNIPLELVLAKTQSTSTRVFKKVKNFQDGEVSLMTMEKGSDGIILDSNSLIDVVELDNRFEKSNVDKFDLKPAKITNIIHTGGVHMYVWGPHNFVAYLSDLRAGDRVFALDSKGNAKVVTVGRMKIERRPLLKIEAVIDEQVINIFIQDDWHVRVFGSKGEIRPSSEVKIGDQLLGYLDEPGRHVGLKISETIKEV